MGFYCNSNENDQLTGWDTVKNIDDFSIDVTHVLLKDEISGHKKWVAVKG